MKTFATLLLALGLSLPAGAAEEYSTLSINGESNITATAGGSGDATWTRDGSTFYLNGAGPYTVSGSTTDTRLKIQHACTVNARGLSMDNAGVNYSPFDCNGYTVDLRLLGTNTLVGAGSDIGHPAINVPDGSTLNITNLDAVASLTATGKGNAAGIGGAAGLSQPVGAINIFGGLITANGGEYGAGIGGGLYNAGGVITIHGGTVSATGGDSAAGIGGGREGACGTVTIAGGTVTAVGNGGGAGIGGGWYGNGGTVRISGGTVHADSYDAAADDIGAGSSGSQGTTVISGGSVHCQNGKAGPRPVDASAVSLYSVKFSGFAAGEAITNFADDAGVSLAYGLDGVQADDEGGVWLWLPAVPSTGSRWVRVNGTRFWCAPGVYPDAALQPFGISVNGESILLQTNNITGTAPWTRDGSTVHLSGSGPYLVTGSAEETPLIVEADCTLTIQNLTLANTFARSPIDCNGHTVNLQLLGTNSLTGSRFLHESDHHPAINVPDGSTLNITNLSDNASLVAALSASYRMSEGTSLAAAIGGSSSEACGTINIFGGIITATGRAQGAGIGCGGDGSGGTVNIFGGTVTAASEGSGAAIGGGSFSTGVVVRISGGCVSATALVEGAAIGAGRHGTPKSVTISGGTVYANSDEATADDIGTGVGGSQGVTTITGGSIHCQNGKTGPQPVNTASVKLYCVTVTGLGANAPITNIAVDAGSPAIGDYGLRDAFADANGNAYLWMTNGVRWFTVNTNHVWALVANANATAYASIPGIVINGHSVAEGSGGAGDTAWTTDGSTCYLNGAGPFAISGSATGARIDARHDCTVVATNLVVDNSGVTYPCFDCDGYAVNLLLSGTNTFTAGEDRPGLEVDASGNTSGNSSTLVVSNLTAGAVLVAQAGANGAGIGGKSGVACGTVEIRGGIVSATGGDYGAGIGGGKGGAGGTVRITGGTVYANSYGADADDIGAGASGGQGTTVISGGSVHCQSAKAGPRPVNASGTTLYCVKFTGLGANTHITSLVVGDGSPALGDYGLNEVYADSDGNVYLWMTDGLRVITLNGQAYYCGVADSDITAVSYAGTLTINGLAIESSPADGSWSHDSSDSKVVYLNGAGPYVLNGATSGYRLMGRHDCTVVASNATLDCTGLYAGFDPDGYTVTLQLFGDNAFRGAADRPGIEVDASGNYSGNSSSLVITNLEPAATLTVKGGYKAAGIGGKNGAEAGSITIQGGIISCVAGQYGAGIGGGYEGRGGTVKITGGTVYVDSYGADADDIGAGYDAGQGTTVISGGSVNCQNSKTGPRPTNASGAALYCVQISGLGSNAAITSLGIGNPAVVNYGLNAVYTDDSGNLYLWLPSADYTIGGTAAGEFSTNSFIKGFTVADTNYPEGITNAELRITRYEQSTGAMTHSPVALPDGALATIYSTNLTAAASEWKGTNDFENAAAFIDFTNAPAVFMKLRVR